MADSIHSDQITRPTERHRNVDCVEQTTRDSPTAKGTAVQVRLRWILLLCLLVALPRIYVAANAVAPARDALRYFDAADTLTHQPLLRAIQTIDAQPLYPLSLAWFCNLGSMLTGRSDPYWLFRAGQVWSVLCSVIFFALAFVAGVQLYKRTVAFLGCLAVAWVPRQVYYASDLLSDSFHAALWMASFALLLWAWRKPAAWKWAAAAGAAGLAYWTRVEALVLPITFLATWGIGTLVPRWRLGWRQSLVALATYSLVFAVFLGTFVAIVGGISRRNTAHAIIGGRTTPEPRIDPSRGLGSELKPGAASAIGKSTPVVSNPAVKPTIVAANAPQADATPTMPTSPKADLQPRVYRGMEGYVTASFGGACWLLLEELVQETRGWLLLLAAAAVVLRNRSRCAMPGGLAACFAFGLCCMVLVVLKMRAGYIAGRYLTPVLPLLGMYAMTGAEALVGLTCRLPRFPWERSWSAPQLAARRAATTIALLTAIGGLLAVPSWFRQLHSYRAGHMAAADWLAHNTSPSDDIYDPNRFSTFFAGRRPWALPAPIPDPLPIHFAVIDPSMVYRSSEDGFRAVGWIADHGRLVAQFPKQPGSREVGIYIFEILPNLADRPPGGPR